MMKKKRIVIIGLGDAGLLTAIRLPKKRYEVVAISAKPLFVSGQGLGNRLAHLNDWKQLNHHAYERFKRLDHVRIIHGVATAVNLEEQTVAIQTIDKLELVEGYDALLIATGTTNGFWRNDSLESKGQIENKLSEQAETFKNAETIAIVGGGPTAVDAASNLKQVHPRASVHLFFSRDKVLVGYPEPTRNDIQKILTDQGVELHGNHRANTTGVNIHAIGTNGAIRWQTGQPPFSANKILWAVGAVTPNNGGLPKELLDEQGFVAVTPHLQHPKHPSVFAVGDIAASDPNRSTARNAGFILAATNLDRYLRGKKTLRSFVAPEYRWGSVLGIQPSGMKIYSPTGKPFLVNKWFAETVLFPYVVQKIIYKGIRKRSTEKTTTAEGAATAEKAA